MSKGNLISLAVTFHIISSTFLPQKGAYPYNISYNNIPKDHISLLGVYFLPKYISKAIYSEVPHKVFQC